VGASRLWVLAAVGLSLAALAVTLLLGGGVLTAGLVYGQF
jgi:hypothetical protein